MVLDGTADHICNGSTHGKCRRTKYTTHNFQKDCSNYYTILVCWGSDGSNAQLPEIHRYFTTDKDSHIFPTIS